MSCSKEKEILTNIIEIYKEMPYLWQREHKDYLNKDLRSEGFKVLLEIYKNFDENATMKTIKKKIENMRTNYAKELKKVILSKHTGAGADEVYVPSLWYFDRFSFLEARTESCRAVADSLPDQTRSDADREVLQEFIATYRREPSLWRLKHRDYNSRAKRCAAIDKLLKKYREMEPSAECEDVFKKINSLRTMYKKEKRKVDEAERAGWVLKSKLWCFDLLAFLDDENAEPAEAGRHGKGDDLEEDEERERQEYKMEFEEDDDNEVTIEHTTLSIGDSDNDDPLAATMLKAKKRKTGYILGIDSLPSEDDIEHSKGNVQLVEDYGTRPSASRIEDRHDAYCRSIAYKLRDLPKHQRLLAEKLINEVLFEAEWGNLTLKHKLTSKC